MSAVLVLNTDNTALHTVTVRHAIGMLVRQVAIVEATDGDAHLGEFPVPTTLRLTRYVRTSYLFSRSPGWTKRGVLKRDRNECAYCGSYATTVDHIVPQSRGGQNTWQNTIAACGPCNARKANRTPDEAAMPLRFHAFVPVRAHLTRAA